MYSNTPSDFDFKLDKMAKPFVSHSEFVKHLKSSSDIVFPIIHGQFGEDGGIQELLEAGGVPFVGTGAAAARRAFDKYEASSELSRQGFATLPIFLLQDLAQDYDGLLKWFVTNNLDTGSGKVVVKPACAGSSIGVNVARGVDQVVNRATILLKKGIDTRVVVEPFVATGKEFTVIILDVGSGNNKQPVALLPTEVELKDLGNDEFEIDEGIFTFRRKYLPTRQVSYYTPPRFLPEIIEKIRNEAVRLFKTLELRHFVRVDGWLVDTWNGQTFQESRQKAHIPNEIYFSDINILSGMEQTSFLFQQSAQVGLSHSDVLRMVVSCACSSYPVHFDSHVSRRMSLSSSNGFAHTSEVNNGKQKVFVIFGGNTSERQVSLMSGTNVWLNLRTCDDIDAFPFLLAPEWEDDHGSSENKIEVSPLCRTVWALPYALVLRHTVEEIVEGCLEALQPERSASTGMLRAQVASELKRSIRVENPKKMTVMEWIKEAKENKAVVYIALHGDIGENGTLQGLLEGFNVPHTGSGAEASRLCMDKEATAAALDHLTSSGILTACKEVYNVVDLLEAFSSDKSMLNVEEQWKRLIMKLQATSICVKPAADGCSTGVARLCCASDYCKYLDALHAQIPRLLPGTLSRTHAIVEMPLVPPKKLIFEPFIETDDVIISSQDSSHDENVCPGELLWEGKSRWLEITIGVMGTKDKMHAFNPSITVKQSGDILSLEEKFQGGTGVNLTPPPQSIVGKHVIDICRKRIELVANTLQLAGLARIDAFLQVDTGELIVIEANTVPGMTPSTVLVHQALAEVPPMYPSQLFRTAVALSVATEENTFVA
ncbi:hypothetical protein O6H91_21G003100 [Diphasiastrum complanatum]|nr:hypothetical protein O6H91_21G003100 [Diphasiastrum complanatum]